MKIGDFNVIPTSYGAGFLYEASKQKEEQIKRFFDAEAHKQTNGTATNHVESDPFLALLMKHNGVYKIKDVIFKDPDTIVFWSDGTKTVVKAKYEPFDKEKGLAMAFMKKHLGNKGKYFDTVKKFTKEKQNENNA